jgi:hypothetical protein
VTRLRRLLIVASCGLLALSALIAIPGGTAESRVWMYGVGIALVVFAIQSGISDPSDLAFALVLGAAPLLAMLAGEGATWLIGPLAVLLLLGGELNALAWVHQGREALDDVGRRRLMASLRVAVVALIASLGVSGLGRILTSGTGVAYLLGAIGLVGMALVLAPRSHTLPWRRTRPQ